MIWTGWMNPDIGRMVAFQIPLRQETWPAEQTVRIRFGASGDESVAFAGWDVDDITVGGITNTPFFTLAPDAGACTISANAGSPQSAVLGTAFATPLKALAQKLGAPLSGLNVTFTAPAAGASGTFT